MTARIDIQSLFDRVRTFAPETDCRARFLAFYAAGIAIADNKLMRALLKRADEHDTSHPHLYETVLQSYLFLGFPRMLQAADLLNELFPTEPAQSQFRQISPDESHDWFSRGERLCRNVYRDAYDPLKQRIEAFAPEIFRWMIIEGYGKVLSRPVLSSVERELAIVGSLIADNRPTQLFSHMRGALNVGAEPSLVVAVVEDLGEPFGDGYHTALNACRRLGIAP